MSPRGRFTLLHDKHEKLGGLWSEKAKQNLIYCFSSLYKLTPIWRVHIYWKSFWYTFNEIIYWNQWRVFYFKYCVHAFLPVGREAARSYVALGFPVTVLLWLFDGFWVMVVSLFCLKWFGWHLIDFLNKISIDSKIVYYDNCHRFLKFIVMFLLF